MTTKAIRMLEPIEASNRVTFVSTVVYHLAILLGAHLFAVQIRLQIPFGNYLPPEYDAQPPLIFIIFIVASLITGLLTQSPLATDKNFASVLAPSHPFRQFMVTLVLANLGVLLLLPEVSQLQVIYFAVLSLLFGILCIAVPCRIYPQYSLVSIINNSVAIWNRRSLLLIWLRFNIKTRYSQQALGILWIILLPVALSVALSFAFTQFLRIQLDVPFISFYMAALVPYSIFANGVLGSSGAIIHRSGIISQVYFPREILVLLNLGEVLVDFSFSFAAMLVISFFLGLSPNIYYLLLPVLLLILVVITLGLMFLVSSLTIIIRDIPQLLAVVMQLFFYITPIIYPVDQFTGNIRYIFALNPIAALVQGFRDIIVYGRMPDMVTLYFPIVFAGIIFVIGYAVFKSLETEMADLI